MTSKSNYVIGNWKMNLGVADGVALARELNAGLSPNPTTAVWIAPPSLTLPAVAMELQASSVKVGAQNLHWESNGAYTGEISAEMLTEHAGHFAIIGHSERRTHFGETNETAAMRAIATIEAGLIAAFCIGETERERTDNRTQEVLSSQLDPLLSQINDPRRASSLLLCYEPVWAIGSGAAASLTQIEEVHQFLRDHWSNSVLGSKGVDCPPLIYGGSVSPDNFAEIIASPLVSGALVGGASLVAEKFLKLVEIAQSSMGESVA